MSNQVTRLRDEISRKELTLAKDEQEHKRLDKDNEALKVLSSGLSVAALWSGSRLLAVCASTGRAAGDEAPAGRSKAAR